MERRTRVLMACVLFTAALLIGGRSTGPRPRGGDAGHSTTVLGAIRLVPFDAALLTALAQR